MTVYVLGIGSNINAEYQCRQMIAALEQRFGEVRVSELVTTKAVGLEAPDYINGVVCVESDMSAETLQQWCKRLEEQLGRDREQHLCAADIDLLLALDCSGALAMDKLINQVKEPWFRPLVTELLNRNMMSFG
ncbi:2-amino-4-hydroxy-6-hydroxymethyldihydropteridine diphosphokinase [Endozoicomonas sp. GU-1]|uniref:2-amino-4-hydroxy-6- hydroxymethyldihydropteridine diphosphokinase n=1 Tax=Endozoicomonas sp. GU-1 TaxID=3009078 RepID=UPI0022B51E78|nr:2-amino-4-hydroxy-6-hydroxymethyldihydropteridine diphosphokinase [Endozoicomonas sp. GU-1]WBA82312.1 2-amino-4-hydroxy-6-hydroxymethyldihydropteridine diphosphokinase [Endozoicomonas sp. GU-1]WBA85248.1 2-amino-4-hydroxy-6-hydroxymethyldihydropteridine diphosphokinase [Endozoicomonas sp. GU-1]